MEIIDKNFLDEIAEQQAAEEIGLLEEAISQSKELARENEAEMHELIKHLKFRPEAIEAENEKENEQAEILAQEAEERLQLKEVDQEIVPEEILDLFSLETQIVGGEHPGHYWDITPYHAWGRVYPHNEGGVTVGSAQLVRSERKMFLYARAHGAGLGITDDNDVTVYGRFFYGFRPRKIGMVRVYVPFISRGWYRVRSNDKWWNSKEAKAEVTLSVRLFQYYWGAPQEYKFFSKYKTNGQDKNRLDRFQSLYSDPMAVGSNRLVIAMVTCKLRVETEGSGSLAILSFRRPDCIFIPGVRFEFS